MFTAITSLAWRACDRRCWYHLARINGKLLTLISVYCSAATREILLRLERYPCRINYAKGLLEARQQTYKHLNKVLVCIPGLILSGTLLTTFRNRCLWKHRRLSSSARVVGFR